MGFMNRARTHAEKVEDAIRTTANSKDYVKRRSMIVEKVIRQLSKAGEVTEINMINSLSAIEITDTVFLRFFSDLNELDKEIQIASWEQLLSRLRQVVIGTSAPHVLHNIAQEYEKYAMENVFLFEYAISAGRYNGVGQRYFRQLIYLIKIVLLSNDIQRSAADLIAKNYVEILHGVTLLEVDRRKGKRTHPNKGGRALLDDYIYNIFQGSYH